LKPIAGNPQLYQLVQERFQREAAILEELGDGSNQIPRLYAYFCDSGQFYLVQEWIQGQTLSHKLQQEGLLSESSVQELLLALLPVLEYVHSKKIVHRDIKPDNIILRSSDGKPVLIDFGAVKETMRTTVATSGNSGKSIVIGTPGYMPSEQSTGLPVYASDLYSLGLTAIYLLTGIVPAELETDSLTGGVLWRQSALNVSPSFAAVLDRAIQPYWRDRYPTAQAMLDAVQRAEGAKEQEKNISHSTKCLAFSSPAPPAPKRTLFLMGSLIVGGLIGASVITGFFLTKSSQPVVKQTTSPTPAQIASTTDTAKPTSQSRTAAATDTTKPTSTSQPVVTATPLASPSTISSTALTSANDYSWLSEKTVTDADLTGRSAFELDILRNSIYARHGRRFSNKTLQTYFNDQSWYRPVYSPDEFPDSLLSSLEKQNAAYILEYQKRYGLRWVQ
jgi:serine/threonine-protein kinase